MATKIKSLILFNLDEIFTERVKDLIVFVTKNNITNTKDITSILTYYVFTDILKTYKEESGLILFYLSTKCYNWLLSDGGIVRDMDFQKVTDIFTKKIKFPIVITSLSYTDFQNLLASNSPEYDELINNYQFISDFWTEIMLLIKNLKFNSLDDKLSNSFLEQAEIISSFKKSHGRKRQKVSSLGRSGGNLVR